jgi:hypothetical protein
MEKRMTTQGQHRLRHAGMRRFTVVVALSVQARTAAAAEAMARAVALVGTEGSPYERQIAVRACIAVD